MCFILLSIIRYLYRKLLSLYNYLDFYNIIDIIQWQLKIDAKYIHVGTDTLFIIMLFCLC